MPTLTLRAPTARNLTRLLNTQAVSGMTCLSITHSRGKTVLTFEETDAPLALWYAVRWTAFYHPAGWDYALHDSRFVLYTRPLPTGSTAEMRRFSDRTHAELEAWLADKAQKGKHLVAAWEDTYYFAPAEPTTIRYRAGCLPIANDANRQQTMALPAAPEPDADGWYFIAYTGKLAIFADIRGEHAARDEDIRAPFDAWQAAARRDNRSFTALTTVLILTLILLPVVLIVTVVAALQLPHGHAWREPLINMATILLPFGGAYALLFLLPVTRSRTYRFSATIHSPADYPRRLWWIRKSSNDAADLWQSPSYPRSETLHRKMIWAEQVLLLLLVALVVALYLRLLLG